MCARYHVRKLCNGDRDRVEVCTDQSSFVYFSSERAQNGICSQEIVRAKGLVVTVEIMRAIRQSAAKIMLHERSADWRKLTAERNTLRAYEP